MSYSEQQIMDLLDKQALYENMMTYCRAIDRMDEALMKSTYWPDGTDDHGRFCGNAHEWAEIALLSRENLVSCNHHCSNVLIELDGNRAKRETMFLVVTSYKKEKKHQFLGGRYRDLCEKRDGEWKILRRVCIWDWNREIVADPGWHIMRAPEISSWGQFFPDDPIYSDWTQLDHTAAAETGRTEVSGTERN